MSTVLIWISRAAVLVALGALLAAGLSGWGYRNEFWDLGMGFKLIEYALKGGGGAGVVGLLLLVISFFAAKAIRTAGLIALVVGGGIAGFLYMQIAPAQKLPMIHDITTDTVDPPQFVAVVSLRGEKTNSLDYAGKTAKASRGAEEETLVSDLQLAAYPNIKPLFLPMSADDAFHLAARVAREQPWEIHDIDSQARLIEATHTTRWFGFKDDVVIRVRSEGEGQARVDMRSISRIGLSDVGVNAKRIEAYMVALKEAAG
jgi:uncharacterized protein (DUF1499 family)